MKEPYMTGGGWPSWEEGEEGIRNKGGWPLLLLFMALGGGMGYPYCIG